MKSSFRVFSLVIVLALLMVTAISAAAKPSGTVDVQILAVNDFHGNLVPPAGSSGRIGTTDAGGVEYLATHINNLRAQNPNTVVVSAGDMIGASPLISALFHDEPSIEAFNLIGLDFNAVGNHEFDEGIYELIRMQEGGCHPVDGCLDGDDFAGADFRFLAANVEWKKNGKTVFPAYKTRSFNGVHVAFIGMTLEGTPTIVTPSGISELNFLDEADTVNALVPELKKRGIETIVVIIHEGGFPTGGYNECPGISGPIVDIVNRTDDAVDLFITGHTHQAYNCVIDGRIVTSAASFGRVVTDIDLTIDRTTGDVVSASANNNIVTRDVALDPFLTALVAKYQTLVAPLENRVIGSITADITSTPNAAGESALGDVIADAQLAATADPAFGGAVVAFMNPGGIRANFNYAQSGSEGDGNVTYGEAFTVQPFGNSLVTMTLTGTQIDTLLETQWGAAGRILQVSNGFTYEFSDSAPVDSKVDIASIKINGVPIDPNGSYRVTVNSFLADGGDRFAILVEGTDRLGGEVDLDALVNYFAANSPIAPGPQNRIIMLP
jgi:5'-nucleotidase